MRLELRTRNSLLSKFRTLTLLPRMDITSDLWSSSASQGCSSSLVSDIASFVGSSTPLPREALEEIVSGVFEDTELKDKQEGVICFISLITTMKFLSLYQF